MKTHALVAGAALASAIMLAPATAKPLSASMFDVTSRPTGVMKQSTLQKMWDIHKTAKACFEHRDFVGAPGYKLSVAKAAAFEKRDVASPYPAASDNPACHARLGQAPAPLIELDLNNVFFQKTAGLNDIIIWFSAAAMRAQSDIKPDETRETLKATLVEWAKAGALRKGIREDNGERVDWEVSTLIATLVNGYAVSASAMTAQERGLVGAWLNRLVAASVASTYGWRNQNRPYLEGLTTMVWGLTTSDAAAVRRAIDVYKLAIHDMRPDGSHVIDSERSGVALHANQMATGNLVMLAAVLRTALGLDLFSYAVDGRSIHTAVDYVVATARDPSLNRKYALHCPNGGDDAGTIDNPNMGWTQPDVGGQDFIDGWLLAYAALFPDHESSGWALDTYDRMFAVGARYQPFGGSPICLLGLRKPR